MRLPVEMREHILSYLGSVDYINATQALHMIQYRFSPGRIFTDRGKHYNVILASIRRLVAAAWGEISQYSLVVHVGNIWIGDQKKFDRLYNLLIRLQAAIRYSRGIKIEMTMDPLGNLRLGDYQYWRDNMCTVFEEMSLLKGDYTLRIRSIEDKLDQRRIYCKPVAISKEFKSGHSKDPMSPFYEYCKSLGHANWGNCMACNKIKANKPHISCLMLNLIATTPKEQKDDLAYFGERTLESLLQFGITGESHRIESIVYSLDNIHEGFWGEGYIPTMDMMLDHRVNERHLQDTSRHKFCSKERRGIDQE